MNPVCSSLSWKPQVQLCLEGRSLLEACAKPLCPDRELQVVLCYRALLPSCPSRKWDLLSIFFFPRSYLPFLVHKCLCHICSLPSGTWWGGRSHSAQLLPKKVCLSDSGLGNGQEEQPVHQTGAAGGISVSHGCYTVCSLCSELLLTPSGDEQVRSISILSYVLLPKYSLPPFGPIYRRRWWEHTVRFCGTQIILSKVFTVTWLFSTTVKWTPAFKNHPVTVC